jgi:hypothetical protein
MQLTLLISTLLLLAFQDIRTRKVWVLLFPVVLVLSIGYKWNSFILEQYSWNLVFVVFSLLSLTLYLTIKERRLVAVWKGYFSIGDILYLLAIVPLFNFPLYLFYFTTGTFLCLLTHATSLLLSKKAKKSVPYAGYMSIYLIPTLLFENQVQYLIIQLLS